MVKSSQRHSRRARSQTRVKTHRKVIMYRQAGVTNMEVLKNQY